MNEDVKQAYELENLAVEIGKFIHYWGFKKIHGRIWTYIFLADTPPDAGVLMKKLNVSKALMSLSLNDLLDHQVIKEAGKSSKGTQTYMANPQILDVILQVLRNRERKMLSSISEAQKQLEACPQSQLAGESINSERLKALGMMVDLAQSTLDNIMSLGELNLDSWNFVNGSVNEISSQ